MIAIRVASLGRRWSQLGREGLTLLSLVVPLAGLFRRLLAGWMLAGGDLQLYFFPYWAAAARAWRAGRLPLWNPYLFAGAPLLANSQVGVFYPLNWPLWLLSGPTLAGAATTLHVSVWLHVGLAALTAYLLARRLGLSRPAAVLTGLLYGGGGFVGVHVEHLNQLQGLAWLPLTLLPARHSAHRAAAWPTVWNVVAYALILLAGHTQMAFISAVGIVVFRLVTRWRLTDKPEKAGVNRSWIRLALSELSRLALKLWKWGAPFIPFALAGLLAAVQLLPTLELSRHSLRAGGLPWREAISFSLVPWQAHRVLLPAYLLAPALPEGVAYLGLIGLGLAGWGSYCAWRARHRDGLAALMLAATGLFLALGAYNPLYLLAARVGLPGVVQFRAPARFLALYALGAALLAGLGLESLPQRLETLAARREVLRWVWRTLSIGIVILELALAAEHLPHAQATSPRAYSDLRPATAHLVAAAQETEAQHQPAGRFLSISKMLFEPGDKAEIESIYGDVLDAEALWAYLVAAKAREVLAPNLPLAFAVPAVDGYDGGLLPLRHYAAFARLLLPEGTLDGRLRENLETIPDARWLALLDVRFLITDKVGDLWAAGVFYDRQFASTLAPGATLTLAWLPANFTADRVQLLFTGNGTLEVTLADGQHLVLPLPTGEGITPQAVSWNAAAQLEQFTLRAAESGLRVTGATLVNAATGAFYPLTLSERFRLVHSGDVKIYEAVRPAMRAQLLHAVTCLEQPEDAWARLAAPHFEPETLAVLEFCPADWSPRLIPPTVELPADAEETVQVLSYTPERVELAVRAHAPGVLLLKDAWYPGWEVTVVPLETSRAAPAFQGPALRAQGMFRGAPIEAGAWRVIFTYRATSLRFGAVLSGLGLVALTAYGCWRRRQTACGASSFRPHPS